LRENEHEGSKFTTYDITNIIQEVISMDFAHVTTKGRIVIPFRARRKLGIKSGTKVCFIERKKDREREHAKGKMLGTPFSW
jgi:AbrB family looped-hinge helix DNA binding protein